MRPAAHVVISLGVGAGLAYFFKSCPAAVSCFIGGVFIDIDHHIDYLIARGKIPNYKELNDFCDGVDGGWKPYLIFHSFEALLIAWLLTLYFQLNAVWAGFLIGVTVHLMCDQVANPIRPLGYFSWYRFKVNYDKQKIFTQRYFDELEQKKK